MSNQIFAPSRIGVTLPSDIHTNSTKKQSEKDKEAFHDLMRVFDNWDNLFRDIVSGFITNYDLYRGSGSMLSRLNTKSKIFDPIVKSPIEEIISYLKTNPRSITINIGGQKEIQDIVNKLISNIMIENNLYNKILKSFTDFMIYGISLFKVESSNEKVINIHNVDIKTCLWDINCDYDDFKPAFFIREYIESNFSVSNKYGHEFVEHRSKVDFYRINLTKSILLTDIKNTIKESKDISVQYGDDVFSKSVKNTSKEQVDKGLSQIIEYYVLTNLKDEKENKVKKLYTKYVFVNGLLAEEEIIAYNAFPYISMAKYIHDADSPRHMFDSKVNDLKSEILHANMIENSIIDSITCNANGTLILNKGALQDKDKQMRNLKSDVVVLETTGGAKLTDVMMNLPPTQISQVMVESINQIQSKIRAKLGLINFDPNMTQAKSGYHEMLRLDRESQSISNLVSPIDNALKQLGKVMYQFIQRFSLKSIDSLLEYIDHDADLEGARELLQDFSNMSDLRSNVEVSESRESPNNTMKVYNEIQMIADITGQPLSLPLDMIADMLNVGDNVKELLNQLNTQDEDPMRSAEIREKNASAQSKEADSVKKIAEAKNISEV